MTKEIVKVGTAAGRWTTAQGFATEAGSYEFGRVLLFGLRRSRIENKVPGDFDLREVRIASNKRGSV